MTRNDRRFPRLVSDLSERGRLAGQVVEGLLHEAHRPESS
jgi:hypothetical protein